MTQYAFSRKHFQTMECRFRLAIELLILIQLRFCHESVQQTTITTEDSNQNWGKKTHGNIIRNNIAEGNH